MGVGVGVNDRLADGVADRLGVIVGEAVGVGIPPARSDALADGTDATSTWRTAPTASAKPTPMAIATIATPTARAARSGDREIVDQSALIRFTIRYFRSEGTVAIVADGPCGSTRVVSLLEVIGHST